MRRPLSRRKSAANGVPACQRPPRARGREAGSQQTFGAGAEEAEEPQFLAAFRFQFKIRTCWGRHFERVSLAPSYSRRYHSLLSEVAPARSGQCGARSHARTPSRSSSSLLPLPAPRPRLPPPPLRTGLPSQSPRRELDLVLPRGLELSGRRSQPGALWSQWRRKSQCTPAATPPRQVLPSFCKRCKQEPTCPLLQVPGSPGANERGHASGSGAWLLQW